MRIGYNASFLGQEGTGSGQYTRQLLAALAEVSGRNEYVLYARASSRHDNIAQRLNLQTLRTPFTQRSDHLDKLWFEQLAFPRACHRASLDLAHVPYFASPLHPTIPTVVTVHDLIPLLLPAYQGSIMVRLYTHLVAAAARRADQVITDSLASKDDIVKHLHVSAERVHVVYLAADPACRPISDEAALAAARLKYDLPDTYVLYLGGFDQRKNLGALLQAYQRVLRGLGSQTPPLVIAGRLPSADTPLFPDPKRMARELNVEGNVVFTGWVAEEDKPAVYSSALFFTFLSIYEGFGLMPLEAMSCGTPVLASDTSSLPEVVGGGGLLVDPDDVDEIAKTMIALLRDRQLRQRLGLDALVQAAKFDWTRTAQQTLAVYALAVTGPN